MPISGPGVYTVVATGSADGKVTSATTTFTVVVSGLPPTVTITAPANNAEYTYYDGGPTVSVPTAFTATSPVGTNLTSLTGSLTVPGGTSRPLDITVNSLTRTPNLWNGTSPIDVLTASGMYTLRAKATNDFSSDADPSSFATATPVEFWVNRIVNPVDQPKTAFQDAAFSVVATLRPGPTYTYRWQRQSAANPSAGFQPLSDGGAYSGTATLSLGVTRVTGSMSGDKFRLVISGSAGGDIISGAAVLTVNKLPLTVTADNKSKVYGENVPPLTSTITGFFGDQTLATSGVTGSPDHFTTATGMSPVAGSPYTITPSLGSLAAENYDFINFVNGSLTVTPLPVSATVGVSKVYDGTNAVNFTSATGTLTGVFQGDTVTLNFSGATGTYGNKNVGTNKPVAVTGVGLGGGSAGNYVLNAITGTGSITALAISSTTTVAKTYDGLTSAPAPTSTNTTLAAYAGGDSLSLVFTNAAAAFANKNVGQLKPLTVTGVTLGGADAGNYTLTASGTGSITAKAITSTTTVTKTYDGLTSAPTPTSANTSLAAVAGSDSLSLVFTNAAAAFTNKNVGQLKPLTVTGVTLGGTDAGNYTFTPGGVGEITAKGITSTTTVTKTYDGTDSAPLLNSTNTSLTGVVSGDAVTLNFANAAGKYADKNVGSKAVTISGLTLATGGDAGNYTLTASGTGSITAKTITSVTTVTKAFDGNTSAPAPSATNTTLSGVISPDAVSLVYTGATAVFDNPTVGTGKTVTVTGLTLTGNTLGNYSLTSTGTGSITSGTGCTLNTFTFSGSSSSSGTAGNIRTFTVNGVSVKASAFSRAKPSPGGALVPAYLGIFSGGLGVTDTSEGDGSSNRHTVDNIGRDNFVLFEFSQPVVVKRANLGYVVSDSDLSVWVGNAADPFNNHLTLTDTMLNGFAREDNLTDSSSTRWATLNAGQISGNVLVVAGWLDDTTPEDQFKIGSLEVCTPGTAGTPVTLAYVSNGGGTFGTAFTSTLAAAGGTPAYTYSIATGALPGGLTLNAATGVISGTPTAAGTFAFTAKVVDSVGTTGNSTASLNCSITIAKAVLTVDVDDEVKVYGAANPALSYVLTGFVNGQSLATSGVTGLPTLSTTALNNSPVRSGGYPITATAGTLASANYSFAFLPGVLTVKQAPLTIRADNKTMVAGAAALPTLTATYIGLVPGETPAVVTGMTLTTSAVVGSQAGTYAIVVNGGTAANYSITPQNGTLTITTSGGGTSQVVSGIVFLDMNGNKVRDNTDEVALGGIVVKAYQGSTVKATTTTSATGAYSFTLAPGTYEVDSIEPTGLTPTNPSPRHVTVAATAVAGPDIGLAMNFNALNGLRSDGNSQGYWKNNLSKAIAGSKKGVQETQANMFAYTTTIANLGISPFAGLTPSSAMTVFNGGDQLSLQLLAAEYNFVSGRFINRSQALTYAFIAWGEYVLKNRTSYSASYVTYIKDWMDAFNNGHGDEMFGSCQ